MNRVAPGLYSPRAGVYYARVSLHGRRTWRKLKARKLRAALRELVTATFAPGADSFSKVADLYIQRDCPTKHTRWQAAPEPFRLEEVWRVGKLKEFYRTRKLDTIDLASLVDYHRWRTRGKAPGALGRSVDKETQTLSNLLNFAVFELRTIVSNPIRSNRPRFAVVKSRARDRMPESADVIHALANHLFGHPRTEVHAWHCWFAMFTGCRTSELLRLRLDAAPDQAGYIQWQVAKDTLSSLYTDAVALLHLQRSKAGLNPWTVVGPEFGQMLRGFLYWHAQRFPDNPYFFPSPFGGVIGEKQFGRAVVAAGKALQLPGHITPHGFRAFYVTKRRRDLIPDPVVAAEIGDKTVSLIASTYGETPGKGRLSWLPKEGLPAWLRWRSEADKMAAVVGGGL